ncbi:MAG TPA: ferrous iron transport protein B [Treponemataceae bacterium]|nr:ferrous iron transport protein B [Treponemataceae bacterium]
MSKITIALIGNQNAGKTTLFNQLTGNNQHVGNFPGVTVEKKTGVVKHQYIHPADNQGYEVELVDLPGIYSLSPYSIEECVTRDFLIHEKPDAVINIVDATNIERNLYLTLQLMEMQLPMVLALNMMDEVLAAGNSIDIQAFSKAIRLEAVPVVANKGSGVSELAQRVMNAAIHKIKPEEIDFCEGPVHRAIHSLAHIIEEKAALKDFPTRFAATKLIEGDDLIRNQLSLTQNELDIIGHITDEMEQELGTDRESAIADERYTYIGKITEQTVKHVSDTPGHVRSVKIDKLLTHKYWGIPVFLGIMALIFIVTFGFFGVFLSDMFGSFIDWLTHIVDVGLTAYGLNPIVHSLIIDGVFAGIGSVLSFLPTILVLFFFLSLLEDSGYMARVAFVMDALLRKMGLSGRSIVPMLIGFGCSVPAILATRTISSRRDRKLTIFITPFMSCSAKLPVYSVFSIAFFPGHAALVMIFLYVFGIVVAVLSALLLKNTLFSGKPIPFVMELPSYRLPTIKTMYLHIKEKALDFIKKAFTVIFIATIFIWFFRNFDIRLNYVSDISNSMLASIGTFLSPIFKPLGFSDWRLSTALITGLAAKEVVISTLAVLFGASGAALPVVLSTVLTPVAAISFLVFILLYMPCVAAFAVMRQEIGMRNAILAVLFETVVAWLMAFLISFPAGLFL